MWFFHLCKKRRCGEAEVVERKEHKARPKASICPTCFDKPDLSDMLSLTGSNDVQSFNMWRFSGEKFKKSNEKGIQSQICPTCFDSIQRRCWTWVGNRNLSQNHRWSLLKCSTRKRNPKNVVEEQRQRHFENMPFQFPTKRLQHFWIHKDRICLTKPRAFQRREKSATFEKSAFPCCK